MEKGCVSLFSRLEPTYHSLHISHTCVCLDLLESLINAARVLHLFVHLSLHEVIPQLVNVQVVAHLELSGVLRFVSGSFSNLLVFLLSLDAALHRFLLVCDAALQFKDSFLTVTLLLFNVFHQVIEDVL